MTESNREYLQRRVAEERQWSLDSLEPRASAIHARMAALYEDRIAALDNDEDYDPIVGTRITPA